MRHLTSLMAMMMVTGCATMEQSDPDNVFGAVEADPALELQDVGSEVTGALTLDNGDELVFSAVEVDGVVTVAIDLNGMELNATFDGETYALDGVTRDGGIPTLATAADRAALMRLTSALEAEYFPSVAHATTKAEYDAIRPELTPAQRMLWSSVEGLWSQWPTAVPLKDDGNLNVERAWNSYRRETDNVDYIKGAHDCWDCDYGDGDCQDYKRLGHYFDGANHGNCGVSDSGSQFTKDCTYHDQCVRTSKHGGHSLASLWCDDDFTYCVDDEISAPSCDYDWRGSSVQGSCPSSWNGTNDGCDCFCGFNDPDCTG